MFATPMAIESRLLWLFYRRIYAVLDREQYEDKNYPIPTDKKKRNELAPSDMMIFEWIQQSFSKENYV